MKKAFGNHEWKTLAEKNAMHLAKLHIETANPAKIAAAFREVDALKALEFLFAEAEKSRRTNKHARTAAILEAATLINRKTGEKLEMALTLEGSGKDADTILTINEG